MPKQFNVGDRVKVYGGLHNTMASENMDGVKATVLPHPGNRGEFVNNIWVKFDRPVKSDDTAGGDDEAWVHKNQCVKLKPKPKPKPKPEKKEARRVWLHENALTRPALNTYDEGWIVMTEYPSPDKGPGPWREVREVLAGEVVVTRESLEKMLSDFKRTMKWVDATTNEKTLVLGNLNGFLGFLYKSLGLPDGGDA